MRFRLSKWIPLVAAGCGFLLSLGAFGGTPDSRTLLAAVRGLAGAEFSGRVTAIDWFLGGVWQWSGSQGVIFFQWFGVWILWSLAVFATLWAVSWYSRTGLPGKAVVTRVLPLLVGAACALSLWNALSKWKSNHRDERLLGPFELSKMVAAGNNKVFANPSMLPFLILEGKDPGIKLTEAAQLSQRPSEWRAAQRNAQWDTVVLSGPLTEFKPLLNHLLVSPDWKLSGLTNQGWVFSRGSEVPVVLPAPDSIDLGDRMETALYLAQLCSRYEAMGNSVAARASIERALDLAPKETEVRLHAANFAAARKRWQDVASHAKAALKSSPKSATAHSLLALAMLESGDPASARKSVEDALRAAPADPGTLFLLARAQRGERDYRSEAETLEVLVATCRKTGLPSAGYQAYLAQSYAQVGNAEGATKNYREALASGQLDASQMAAIREALEVVESHSLPGTPKP